MTQDPQPPYWVLARRSGGGWGPPVTWQGRVLLVGAVGGALVLPLLALTAPERLLPVALLAAVAGSVACFVVFFRLAVRHGEPLDVRRRRPEPGPQPPPGVPNASTHTP